MYSLDCKRNNIANFLVNNESLILIEKESQDLYNLKLNDKSILKLNFRSLVKGIYPNIVVSDVDNSIYIFNIEELQDQIEGFSLSENSISSKEIIISKRLSKGVYEKFIYNLFDKTIQKVEHIPSLVFRNQYFYVFYDESKIVSSLSILTGEYEWEVDLGTYGEIRKIIGVAGDNLWVSVNDVEYGKHHLVVIDVKSGKILKSEKLDSRFADFGVMMTEKETVFSLNGRLGQATWLYEYDAQTMQALRSIEVPSLKEHTLGVKSFTVFKDNIYFTATDGSQIVANTVGVLDYNTLTLLWHDKVSPGNLMLDPPQVSDTHLYVLGAEGTLHIFEKEINV